MEIARAREINGRLCQAYFALEVFADQHIPDLSDVSLADAVTATRIVAADPWETDADGRRFMVCSLDETAIPRVLGRAIAALSETTQEKSPTGGNN